MKNLDIRGDWSCDGWHFPEAKAGGEDSDLMESAFQPWNGAQLGDGTGKLLTPRPWADIPEVDKLVPSGRGINSVASLHRGLQ